MKKVLSILAIFCVMIFSVVAFSGCAISLSGGPKANDEVTSNGGLVVRKGDYLYFVNGYVSNSKLSGKDNNYGVAKNGAIYRAKLTNGELNYVTTTDEDGNETKTLTDVELLVPMVAGFEYSNLYIFGDTLYFTTPNTEKDSTGKIRFDLTDVYAVNISGGNVKRIVNALNLSTKNNVNFSYVDNFVYLTYLNNNSLYSIKISGTKAQKSTLIASNVSSFSVSETEDDNANFVYYTRSFTENEKNITGNVLAKFDLKNNKEIILSKDNQNTYSVKKVINGKIYYTKTNSLITNAYIYSKNLENFETADENQYTVVSYSSNQFIFDVQGYNAGVLVNESDELLYLTGTTNISEDINSIYDGSFTILGVYGTKVYGQDNDKNLIRIDIIDKTVQTILSNDVNFDFSVDSNFDYDAGYVYYYVSYTGADGAEGHYLNRVYLNAEEKESEFIGVLLDIHKA